MIFIFMYLTPIIAIIFFANCVSIAKKLKNGQDVQNQTVFGSIMFGFIILSIVWSVLLSS